MSDEYLIQRITRNSEVMLGRSVVRGTRLTVEFILNLLNKGATTAEILDEYKTLTLEDIHACQLYAEKNRSGLDVDGIDLGITTEEVVGFIREGRERE